MSRAPGTPRAGPRAALRPGPCPQTHHMALPPGSPGPSRSARLQMASGGQHLSPAPCRMRKWESVSLPQGQEGNTPPWGQQVGGDRPALRGLGNSSGPMTRAELVCPGDQLLPREWVWSPDFRSPCRAPHYHQRREPHPGPGEDTGVGSGVLPTLGFIPAAITGSRPTGKEDTDGGRSLEGRGPPVSRGSRRMGEDTQCEVGTPPLRSERADRRRCVIIQCGHEVPVWTSLELQPPRSQGKPGDPSPALPGPRQ